MASLEARQEIQQKIQNLPAEQIPLLIEFLHYLEKLSVIRGNRQSDDQTETAEISVDDSAWQAFGEVLKRHTVRTGIADLAQQHDHYLYGKPKQK
jgi:Fic family protein